MLAGNLFHFKKVQTEYGIKQEDHGSKPLFTKKEASQTLLIEFFFYVLSRDSSFVAVAPFFRAKDEHVQTGAVKFFDKALCKLAALSAYLHRNATAWYMQFPPIHSPDRAEDPKTPQVDGGDGAEGSPEDEDERPVASESPSDEADDEGRQ